MLKKGMFFSKTYPQYQFLFMVFGNKDDLNERRPFSWSFFIKHGRRVVPIWQFHKFSDYYVDKYISQDVASESDTEQQPFSNRS